MKENQEVPVKFLWETIKSNDEVVKQEKFFKDTNTTGCKKIEGGKCIITLEKKVDLHPTAIPKEGEKFYNSNEQFFPDLYHGDLGFYKSLEGWFNIEKVTRKWKKELENFCYDIKLSGPYKD